MTSTSPLRDLLVIGHVNLDVLARDLKSFPHMPTSFLQGRISVGLGGAIAHVGRASAKRFRRTALCCLSFDAVGQLLRQMVEELYDETILLQKEGTSASVIPILYRDGKREVIAPLGGVNDLLQVADMELPDVRGALESTDVLYVDGYSAAEPNGRDACRLAMKTAREGGARTVFDVAPHHAYALYSFDDLIKGTEFADIVIVELRTLARFSDPSLPDDRIEAMVPDIVEMARERFPKTLLILRYGECQIRVNHLVAPGVDEILESDEPTAELNSAGYGDRLAMRHLPVLFTNPEELNIVADSLPWNHCSGAR